MSWRCLVLSRFKDGRYSQPFPEREPGDRVVLDDEDRVKRWLGRDLITVIGEDGKGYEVRDWPWGAFPGRNLTNFEVQSGNWDRVVACLNIWQDLPDFKETYETWYPHVDHVIAVDGAYKETPAQEPYSTDGTVEFLRDLDKVELVETEEFWETQNVKRTVYFDRAQKGDLLFIVDADEYVENAEDLPKVPDLDVGWARKKNPLYNRVQDFPRLFKYQPGLHYEGRHHWVHDGDGELVATHQLGGPAQNHRVVPIAIRNKRGINRTKERQERGKIQRRRQAKRELNEDPSKKVGGHEPLRILQLTSLDPGMVVQRLHDAINSATPHESIMAVSDRNDRVYESAAQYNVEDHRALLEIAAEKADIIHCHLRYYEANKLGIPHEWPFVIHHHGTMFRENHETYNNRDGRIANVRFISNLELMSYADDTYFLPNPVEVARHQQIAEELAPGWEERPFKVSHSPSKRDKKGTEEFLQAMEELRESGLDVEPVLIENESHRTSCRKKAASHVCFDSFWLGMQCAGLEAAASGRPVIAGDDTVRDRYKDWLGEVPYTYADNKGALKAQILRLAENRDFWEQEASKVYWYTKEFHDQGSVVERYLDVLDDNLKWRNRLSIKNFNGPLGR